VRSGDCQPEPPCVARFRNSVEARVEDIDGRPLERLLKNYFGKPKDDKLKRLLKKAC
jgi:hypothetical protein